MPENTGTYQADSEADEDALMEELKRRLSEESFTWKRSSKE
jgi:hypothetical protein